MPFGAEIFDNEVRFRLWAPAATDVELCLEGTRFLTMQGTGDGFFELSTHEARAGTRYGFRIAGSDLIAPDPASRANPDDVHGLSEVIDPASFEWQDAKWHGRPWEEAAVYELHVGAFSEAGNFAGIAEHLPYLVELGVTALELMPVADYSGSRGWGYDAVLPFAPECHYGRPEDLKRLVQAAHAHDLMILLDVVYNHFGPDGCYLHGYAPQFFTDRIHTPWGPAIDFEGSAGRVVRSFFIHNALYWLEEFNVDGLRIDAAHAIHDRSRPDILEELADRVRSHALPGRPVHLVLENDNNESRYLRRVEPNRRSRYDAQWNDDFHHAMHVLLTGETSGYYTDYAEDPVGALGRCLAEGFAYQGEESAYRGAPRGEPSADLPTSAFVNFLQNHDQIGNRAFGERLARLAPADAVTAAVALMLLAPQPPMLFMGEEFGASSEFLYFCDFPAELGAAVAAGRRREFGHLPEFRDAAARQHIPDPNRSGTFLRAKLDWREPATEPHRRTLAWYRRLLSVRHEVLMPRLPGRRGHARRRGQKLLEVSWELAGGGRWHLLANLGGPPARITSPDGHAVFCTAPLTGAMAAKIALPSWAAAAFLDG